MPRERATKARKKEVTPMKKRSYKIVDVKNIRLSDVKAGLSTSRRAVFGIDVAKSEAVVSIGGDDAESIVVFKVKQPAELPRLLEIATDLRTAGYEVELAAESTGTYSDVLVYQARQRKLPVFRVSTKFVHDAKEIHDGVSSKHDAKDATLILWLHVQGKSRPWLLQEESQRRAKAVVSRREIYVHAYVANAGRLEALLARHWPELLALGATIGILLLKLLGEFPSPQRITANLEEAKRILRRHRSADKMDAIVASAMTTQGVVMIEEEEVGVSELAKQMLAQWREIERIDKELRELLQRDPVAVRLAALIGPTTAMVLAADLGDLSTYTSPKALEKACGLNLREDSSGKRKSGLHITKRGPSRVRQYLYLAALRLLKLDPIVRAWYASRVARGQKKMCAVIAVLRKLVRSLIFVARGDTFQAAKLFDVRRLDLQQGAKVDVEPTLAEVLQLDDTSVSETRDGAPLPGPATHEEHPQAHPDVPRNAGVAQKNDRAPSPSKRVPSRADGPRAELAKRSDGVPKDASTASQDTDSREATMHPTGRSFGQPVHEETVKVIRRARSEHPAPTKLIERAVS
jgi:transposase